MFKYILIASAATGLAVSAQAQSYESDTGFYLDGGYQYLEIEPDGAEQGVDTNGIAARLGYKFNNVFSLEGELASGIDDGEFDYNTDEDEFNFDDNNDGDFNDLIAASGDIGLNYLVGVFGRADLPITERLDVFARAGYSYIDLDASLATPGGAAIDVADSENGPAVGAGLTYALNENWELRGDYTYYSFEDADTNGAMLGVGYKF